MINKILSILVIFFSVIAFGSCNKDKIVQTLRIEYSKKASHDEPLNFYFDQPLSETRYVIKIQNRVRYAKECKIMKDYNQNLFYLHYQPQIDFKGTEEVIVEQFEDRGFYNFYKTKKLIFTIVVE